MSAIKKELLKVAVCSFLMINTVFSVALAQIYEQNICETKRKNCVSEGATLKKQVNRLSDGKTCKRLPKKGSPAPRVITLTHYGPYGSAPTPGLALDALRSYSTGVCLLSARISKVKCDLKCNKYPMAADAKIQMYELVGTGTIDVIPTPGRLKTTE